ncbi:hypothetical protein K438DRAFT_1976693 [Mycena galopus ATCC 62051]|nr:hypothetical protein K438DRAFT_1976693 [Mycena galopus ATCC 62051]
MAPPASAKTSLSLEALHQDGSPSSPLLVVLQDTDVYPSWLEIPLTHTDLTSSPSANDSSPPAQDQPVLGPEPLPQTSASRTPVAFARSVRFSSPLSRMSTPSDLTELDNDDNHDSYPPRASLTLRPPGVQHHYESTLKTCFGAQQYDNILEAVSKTASKVLDLTVSYTNQGQSAKQKFIDLMTTDFPKLVDYERNWALTGFVTISLKKSKGGKTDSVESDAAIVSAGSSTKGKVRAQPQRAAKRGDSV